MPDLSSKLSIYLRSSGASLVATVVSKGSGFASIWLLNQILTKGAYGNYEFAFTIVSLLLLLGSGGLNHAVMYRLSRLDSPPEELDGHDFAGAALGWSLLISAFLAVLVFVGAPFIEALAGNEDLAFWVSLLSFLIPIGVARGVYQAWHEARQRIPESIFMGKVLPALTKVVLLSAAWLLWPTAESVIGAILLSELGPLMGWYMRTPVSPFRLRGQFSSWDVLYSVKLALTKGLSKTLKSADILMMGFLASAEGTAEYVVASRIALILLLAHNILNSILRPRIGRFLSKENWAAVEKEYDQARSVALIFALSAACFLAFSGQWVLGLFGEYEAAYSVLMVLVATHVMSTSFGMCGDYLNIAGYPGWTLTTTVVLLALNVSLNFVLIPFLGATGAAFATLISFAIVNLIIVALVLYLDSVRVYTFQLALPIAGIVVGSAVSAFGVLDPTLLGGAFVILTTLIIVQKVNLLAPIVRAVLEASLNAKVKL